MEKKQVRENGILSSFRGAFPAIENYAEIDMDALMNGDDDPFFVTLEIAQIGRISRNRLNYDEALVNEIANQLREADAYRGHVSWLSPETYPTSEVLWVGHAMVGDSLWAKGYIPPGKTREDMRRKKARNQKVGTSIYGMGVQEWNEEQNFYYLREFDLISVDLVHAKEASLQTSQVFQITSEKADDIGNQTQPQKEAVMPTREEVLASLTASEIPAYLREAIQREAVTPVTAERDALKVQLGETQNALKSANDALNQFRVQAFESALTNAVHDLTANWNLTTESAKAKVAQLHGTIKSLALFKLGESRDASKIAETVRQTWDENKLLAESVRDSLSGGAAVVSAKTQTAESSASDKWRNPEALATLLAGTNVKNPLGGNK